MTKTKKFLCTRPSLAAILQQKGFMAEKTTSPWNPNRTAWLFEKSEELINIARKYYEDIGKPIPNSLREGEQAQ